VAPFLAETCFGNASLLIKIARGIVKDRCSSGVHLHSYSDNRHIFTCFNFRHNFFESIVFQNYVEVQPMLFALHASNFLYLSDAIFNRKECCVGFEVLIAVFIKVAIFCDISPCSPYLNRRVGGNYHPHLQGRKSVEQEISVLASGATDYTAQYPRRRQLSENNVIYACAALCIELVLRRQAFY
jgi:hypothetical protein